MATDCWYNIILSLVRCQSFKIYILNISTHEKWYPIQMKSSWFGWKQQQNSTIISRSIFQSITFMHYTFYLMVCLSLCGEVMYYSALNLCNSVGWIFNLQMPFIICRCLYNNNLSCYFNYFIIQWNFECYKPQNPNPEPPKC